MSEEEVASVDVRHEASTFPEGSASAMRRFVPPMSTAATTPSLAFPLPREALRIGLLTTLRFAAGEEDILPDDFI